MKKSIGNKTIIMPAPALMVGTYDDNGKPNLITIAWGGICSSEPPSVAISVRKSRYSYESIVKNKSFSVCIPTAKYAAEVDYCGIHSGAKFDKFAETRLTAIHSGILNVPIVEEFPLALICSLTHTHELGIHTQFIGEIIDVLVDEDKLNEKNLPVVEKIDPIVYNISDRSYRRIGEKIRDAFLPFEK